MNTLQMWSLLVGFLAPNVIAVVQQPRWSSRTRTLVTAALSVIFGGITAYLTGDLDEATDVVGAVLIVMLAAMTFYKRFWTPTGIAPAIEAATSPTGTVVVPTLQMEPAAVTPEQPPVAGDAAP